MNDYEIISKLAEGGMAELFLARNLGDGSRRHVVLKRIARERASDTQFVQMFLDEARLAAQLRHPNIAQVFDIGRLAASYYFTMEYVHGVTVEDMIERASDLRTVLPVDAILSILFGTAAGLSHAHERAGDNGLPLGIVHRDISPSNLMVSYEGHVKVVDFGVAKAQMMGRPETQAGEIKGKVGYLSPEQCRLQKLDARSDLYSLGVVAWEMLTGKRLWKRETAFSTMAAIATEDVPAASEYREDLWPEIDALVAKLLATEVKDRFQNAREVIQAVELVAATTRSNTSPSSLAKLMREMFGNPPEPWLASRDAINVSTLPIPAELDTHDEDPSIDTVEHKLTSVFSAIQTPPFGTDNGTRTNLLSLPNERLSTNTDATREIPSLARAPSVPSMRPISRASTEIIPENLQTPVEGTEILPQDEVSIRGSTKMMPTEAPAPESTVIGAPALFLPMPPVPPPSGAIPRGSFGRMPPAGDPTVPLGTQLPPLLPSSGPQLPPLPPVPSSGPQEVVVDSPGPNVPRWPPPPHGDVGRLKWWIAIGVMLAIVGVLVILVTRGNERRVVVAPPPPDSVVIVATTPDATPDAAPIIADAAEPDAAEPDAAVAEVVDAAPPEDAPEETPPPKRTKLRSKNDLNAAFRERRYKEIVGACSELGADGDRAVVCTLAACRARAKEAQDWYRNIAPKQRDGAIRICKQAGHVINDVCATEPCRK